MRRGSGPGAAVALAAALAAAAAPVPGHGAPAPAVLRVAGEVSPLGWPYARLAEGTLDADGRLVFVGSSTAIFARQGGGLAQRIGGGVVLPDARRVAGVGPPGLAADGCVVAAVTFEAGSEAIVRACGAVFTVLVDAGATAPLGGVMRAFDPRVFVAGTDTVGAAATLEDGTVVLLRHDGTGLVEVARSGGPAPTGGTYAAFRLLGVTAAGQLGFRATVTDGPNGLFAASDTSTRPIALVGQASPSGGSFAGIGGGSVHASGRIAFQAALSTGATGVFAVDEIGPIALVRPVALQGDVLPLAGATVRGFPSSIDPAINAAGAVAFRALIEGATEPPRPSGVFVAATDRTLTRVATVRDDLGGGLGTVSRLRDPALADDGSLVVSATIAGGGPGLYVARAGAFAPLARLGDATDVDTGDSRFRFGPASVVAAAEDAVFLGERDAIFRTLDGGGVAAVAYSGRPSPLGGVMAFVGSPTVDGRGTVFFAADLQQALFNEALLAGSASGVEAVVLPDRRLLGGGGIRELFPTGVDALARPAGAASGVVFTAALQGARTSEAVFHARGAGKIRALVRVGQRAARQRIASLGTAAVGGRNTVALLTEVGRTRRRSAIVAKRRGRLGLVALTGGGTRSRAGGRFAELGRPAVGRRGTAFRATLDTPGQEGVFLGQGRRLGLVAGTGDATTTGGRLRTFLDPVVAGDEVWFLARAAGSVAPAGLYRAAVARVPRKKDAALAIEPVLLPGDPAPAPLGGVVVRIDALRVGPSGAVSVVIDVGGGAAGSAILGFTPGLP